MIVIGTGNPIPVVGVAVGVPPKRISMVRFVAVTRAGTTIFSVRPVPATRIDQPVRVATEGRIINWLVTVVGGFLVGSYPHVRGPIWRIIPCVQNI